MGSFLYPPATPPTPPTLPPPPPSYYAAFDSSNYEIAFSLLAGIEGPFRSGEALPHRTCSRRYHSPFLVLRTSNFPGCALAPLLGTRPKYLSSLSGDASVLNSYIQTFHNPASLGRQGSTLSGSYALLAFFAPS